MVATTVIEVGVDIPNATVMIIENAERFGLSQLHQLRGRVGRGSEQSYCILMTGEKLGNDARKRIQTMVRTTDGFEIAETDLQLRGPGDMEGTQQSGILDLKIADIIHDEKLLKRARNMAIDIIKDDPELEKRENSVLARHLILVKKYKENWGLIS
jgi:ATP-dependent DNA helicase RecG